MTFTALASLRTPTLILQGTRDPFGAEAEVQGYVLSPNIRVHWLADGDHSLVPRKSSGHTQQGNWDEAIESIAAFAHGLGK